MTSGARPQPDFRFLFESVPGAMLLVLSPDLRIVAANDLWCAATASDRELVLDRALFDVFPDNPADMTADGVSHVRASLERVLREKVRDVMPATRYDIELPSGQFEERFWCITNSPVFDSCGEVVYIMNRADDVTDYLDLKQVQERGSDDGQELLESVAVRYAREVAEANRMIKEAHAELSGLYEAAKVSEARLLRVNHDLEQCAYVISHDLQAPVRNIAGLAELLRSRFVDADLNAQDEHLFELLDQSTARMLAQIQGLLKLSGLHGSAPIWANANLGELAAAAIEALDETISDVGASVTVIGELPTVEVDRAQLVLLLQNLIGNAIKYRRLDTPTVVEVSAVHCEQPGFVQLVVADNGIGVAEDDQDRIFRMFQRLHSPKDAKYQGTGIGLALVEKITTIHRGSIWVESAGEGQGSAFHLRLPESQRVGHEAR